jgi:two-component system, chemotaxis family, response regulator Rcp1
MNSAFEILLVEDNPGDVELTRESLSETTMSNHLHVAVDGVEAMSFLRREGRFQNVPTPHLILLDLNLPRKDGREVLRDIKASGALREIPVIVFSSSDLPADITQTYGLGANCYVAKPMELRQFEDAVRGIERFWLGTARLPAAGTYPGGA